MRASLPEMLPTKSLFSDDQQGATGFGDLLKCWQQIANVRDLFVVQQDVRVLHQRQLFVRVVDEVRAHVAAIKLHAFNDVEFVFEFV